MGGVIGSSAFPRALQDSQGLSKRGFLWQPFYHKKAYRALLLVWLVFGLAAAVTVFTLLYSRGKGFRQDNFILECENRAKVSVRQLIRIRMST